MQVQTLAFLTKWVVQKILNDPSRHFEQTLTIWYEKNALILHQRAFVFAYEPVCTSYCSSKMFLAALWSSLYHIVLWVNVLFHWKTEHQSLFDKLSIIKSFFVCLYCAGIYTKPFSSPLAWRCIPSRGGNMGAGGSYRFPGDCGSQPSAVYRSLCNFDHGRDAVPTGISGLLRSHTRK